MKADMKNESVTFQIKKGEKLDEEGLRQAIETKAKFKTGKVLEK